MWRHQMTKLPETSTASSTEAPQIVEEISQGKVNIKGCTVEISHVFFTYADQDNVRWFDSSLTWLFRHGNHEFFK